MNLRRDPRAFTLLELLVAAVLTVLLAGLVLAVTRGVLDLWRRTQGGYHAAAQAAVALELLERDLQAACYFPDGRTWLAADVIDDPARLAAAHGWRVAERMKPAGADSWRALPPLDAAGYRALPEARFGLSGVRLRLVAATQESTAEPTWPRAIAYQLARRPLTGPLAADNPAPVRYALYRSTVNATTTLAQNYELAAAAFGSLALPASADALAANVVDFGIWLYAREADGRLRRIFPADESDRTHAARGPDPVGGPGAMPVVADVFLRVLTEEGAARIEAIELGRVSRPPGYPNDAAWWWAEAAAHSQVFTRRIEIVGGSR